MSEAGGGGAKAEGDRGTEGRKEEVREEELRGTLASVSCTRGDEEEGADDRGEQKKCIACYVRQRWSTSPHATSCSALRTVHSQVSRQRSTESLLLRSYLLANAHSNLASTSFLYPKSSLKPIQQHLRRASSCPHTPQRCEHIYNLAFAFVCSSVLRIAAILSSAYRLCSLGDRKSVV